MALLSTIIARARVNRLASGWRTATGAGLCFSSRSPQLLLSICAVDAHGQLTDLTSARSTLATSRPEATTMDILHYAPGLEGVKSGKVWQSFAGKMVTITILVCIHCGLLFWLALTLLTIDLE
jgi:hypothetical protein